MQLHWNGKTASLPLEKCFRAKKKTFLRISQRKMQIIIARWKKSIFLRISFPQKKKKEKKQKNTTTNIYTTCIFDKTTTMYDVRRRRKKNTLGNCLGGGKRKASARQACLHAQVRKSCWCFRLRNNTNTEKPTTQHSTSVSACKLMLLCCRNIFCRSTSCLSLAGFSTPPTSFPLVQCQRTLSIAGWKTKSWLCVHRTPAHNTKWREKNPNSFAYVLSASFFWNMIRACVPARFRRHFSSFRIFSPLCCCSRVRPVEFFKFHV